MKQRRLALFAVYFVFCAHSKCALYTSPTCTNYKTRSSKYNWNTTVPTVIDRLRCRRIVLRIAKLRLYSVNSLSTRFFRQALPATLASRPTLSHVGRFVFNRFRHRPSPIVVPERRTLFRPFVFRTFPRSRTVASFFRKIITMVQKWIQLTARDGARTRYHRRLENNCDVTTSGNRFGPRSETRPNLVRTVTEYQTTTVEWRLSGGREVETG